MSLPSIILVCVSSGLTIITSFMKDMRKILILILIASITTAINYFMSDSSGGYVAYIIATLVALTSGIFTMKGKKVPIFVVVLYCLAFVVANIFAYEAWYTAFAVVGAITGVIGTTRENGMSYHVWILANSALWMCYDIFAEAYYPLVQHLIFTVIFAVGLGLDIYKNIKKRSAEQNGRNYSNH